MLVTSSQKFTQLPLLFHSDLVENEKTSKNQFFLFSLEEGKNKNSSMSMNLIRISKFLL